MVTCDPEIEQPEQAGIPADHQVRRLYVAMDDAVAVGILQAARQFPQPLDLPADPDSATAVDDVRERLPGDVLHRDVRAAFVFPDPIDADDVGMLDARRELRLLEKAAPDVLVEHSQHFDRDQPVERGIVREVHHAHPALAQAIPDLVRAYLCRAVKLHGDSCSISVPFGAKEMPVRWQAPPALMNRAPPLAWYMSEPARLTWLTFVRRKGAA